MTIVTRNSLTVSNINDGTITHTAYAYSADGTDRFTTVYPNLNLLKNTKSQSYTSTGTATYNSTDRYPLDGVVADMLNKPLTITYNYEITNSSGTWSGTIRPTYGLGGTNQSVSNTNLSGTHKETTTLAGIGFNSYGFQISGLPAGTKVTITNLKVEFGSIVTPYMPSASEATTADWPSYIGQYSDFTSTASTDPTKYAPWTVFKGNDGKDGANGKDGIAGKDGVGIKTTDITYAISTSGTTAPTTGWTSSVPSLVKGQYLWTKTVWNYTDNSSETGYSVTYISKDGNNGNDGIAGKDGVGILTTTITYAGSTSGTTAPTSGWTSTVPTVAAGSYLWTKTVWAYTDNTSETGYSVAKMGNDGAPGSNGAPGKVVSDTEPISLFKGLTWKYSGSANLTASDGTVINPNTEYFYNGSHWVINYFSVNNFASESITSDKIDGKNLTITNGAFVSNTTNGPVSTSTEIKDNHIAISKTDGTVNTKNDIALDSEQGLAQKFTNISTGFYRTAGINYQGPFTSDSDGNYAQLTPQGTKLSTDVPWTTLAATGGFSGSIQFAIQNGIAFFSLTQVLTPKMTAETWYQIAQLPSGSKAIPSINRVTTAFANASVWGFYVSTSGGLYLQTKTALNTPGSTSANTIASFPIG